MSCTHFGQAMEIYLVGGAVRDKLLGLPVKERDWVVVGATPQEMLKLGFRKVGRDFPVFLHPKTHEEYALARTERKTGKGYTNFVCYAHPSVTLEDDLKRRDLTINAIAQTKDGKIIDPFDGSKDLKKHILRHVSPAFAEDPVRILRIARFAARFDNFKVDRKTNKLMQEMLAQGEVDALVPERVWQELERALSEEHPEKFFMVLKDCQVLPKLFPEIAANFTLIKKALMHATKLTPDPLVRFAAITFNFSQEDDVKLFCKRYRLPSSYKDLSRLIIKLKNNLVKLVKSTGGLVTILEQTDVYRRPKRLEQLLLAYEANNKKFSNIANRLHEAYQLTQKIRLTPKMIAKTDKKDLRQMLHDKRRKKLEQSLAQTK